MDGWFWMMSNIWSIEMLVLRLVFDRNRSTKVSTEEIF